MLQKILSLVLNYEKKKSRENTDGNTRKGTKQRGIKPSTEVDVTHAKENISDPWFN